MEVGKVNLMEAGIRTMVTGCEEVYGNGKSSQVPLVHSLICDLTHTEDVLYIKFCARL